MSASLELRVKEMMDSVQRLERALLERNRIFDRAVALLNLQLPFIGFQPSPHVSFVFRLTPNVSRSVELPDGTKAFKVSWFEAVSPLYMSLLGGVTLPAATDNPAGMQARGVLINPQGWFACERRTLDFLCDSNIDVSVICFIQH